MIKKPYFLAGFILLALVSNVGLVLAQTPPEFPSWNVNYEISSYGNPLRLPYPPPIPYSHIDPSSKIYPEPYPWPSRDCYPSPCYPPGPYEGRRYFSERGLYSYGLNLVYSHRCGEAIRVFRDFLYYYPRSSLADNAVYWTGECYYYMKNYHRAIREFDKVIRRIGGNKVPDAMLKKGYSYLSLGRYEAAFRTLEDLIYRYPRSRPAYLARMTLNRYYGGYSPYYGRYSYYFPPSYCRPCYGYY